MPKIKEEFILVLIPSFAGWEPGIQYDFILIPVQICTSGKAFFFQRKLQTIFWGAVLYVSVPSEE